VHVFYLPASFAIMRIDAREINNQAGWCIRHIKPSDYFSTKSNTHKKSVYGITHYGYRWLQDIWKKAVRKAQYDAIKIISVS